MNLAGRRIWVTRPAGQAAGLVGLLTARGANVFALPLLEIGPPDDPLPLQTALADLAAYDLAIAVSPSAVAAMLAALPGAWPATLALAVVGPGSLRAAHAADIRNLVYPQDQFDSEGLLAIPRMQSVAGQRILLLRGNGGRELLPDTLRARGAWVDVVQAYSRAAPALAASELLAELERGCAAMIVTSSEAAQHLFRLGGEAARQSLQSVLYCVPHPRIAEALAAEGARHILQSATGDAAMTDRLCHHFSGAAAEHPLPGTSP
ncbi:uroporphyrinogen-III synthase [Chitinilyticum piscinae]|uniref:Uroporphyrinogen-III synthase n=1 Tax=Chitinilyticum piscinae TaxID=2866724 RepID=A0A8J7FIC7_9NEIS|nr:uroporphyrinogen-III synthase [Chitinilyticum piscinae]MBE9608342.1 uroporphyrinogen-III synthase [Chitinilyticum piscinae]